jgi:3',5'-cyclic AMP phosphodiesterase CpdA
MTRVLHLTDLHVVEPPARASGRLDTARLLTEAVDHLLERRPMLGPWSAVLVTGDVSDDGSHASYRIVREQLERLAVPILMLPGNHDRREPMREVFADLPGMPAEGPLDWTVDLGALRVIGLDTLIEGESGGALQAGSLEHLRRSLSDAGERPVLVALHHPPIETGIRFMDRIALRDSERLAAVLTDIVVRADPATRPGAGRGANVRLVCGHVHAAITGSLAGITVCAAPSTCSAFALDLRDDAPEGFMLEPRGFMVHDWRNGAFSSTAQSIVRHDGPHPFR